MLTHWALLEIKRVLLLTRQLDQSVVVLQVITVAVLLVVRQGLRLVA
jgi:hypothetical protein